jgi:myosin heavy subunit
MNPPKYDYYEDMSGLYHLSLPTIFQHLRQRFQKNNIYVIKN